MNALTVPIPTTDTGEVDRIQWLVARRELKAQGFFSASDAGTLAGEHPFKTLGDVAADHLAPAPIRDEQNAAMERGHYLEPALLNWLADKVGVAIVPPKRMYAARNFAATPDGEFVGSTTDQPEAKTTNSFVGSELSLWWRMQGVAQVAARPGLERVHFVVLDGSLTLSHHVVEPSEAEVEALSDAAGEFLATVAGGCVPQGVILSPANVTALWPKPVVESVEATAEIAEAHAKWAFWRGERLAAKAAEDEHKAELIDFIRGADVLTIDGEPVATYGTHGQGRALKPAGEWK